MLTARNANSVAHPVAQSSSADRFVAMARARERAREPETVSGVQPVNACGDPSNSPTLSQAATMQGVILGTAAYMPPEQARGPGGR